MEEIIALRYVEALKSQLEAESFANAVELFKSLSTSFDNSKFAEVLTSPLVSNSDKDSILLDVVKSASSDEINNLMKLLVLKNRAGLIPAISNVLSAEYSKQLNEFNGKVYSSDDMSSDVIEDLAKKISTKVNSKINLTFVKSDFNGIKVDVEALGLEINFSRERINNQLIDHILKAI